MKSKELEIIILSNLLGVLGFLSINIYLPSLPSLIHFFHTKPENLKLSISLFLLGYALSQFFWGSLSERMGRKKPVLFGMLVACIGTTMVMLAPNILFFNIGRCIEGIGIGCASVLARALLTDSFDKANLSIALSYFSTAASIMPALAPIIGGYLLHWFGWRFIFLFLLIYTSTLVISFYKRLPETHKSIRKDLKLKEAIIDYWEVFTHREFIGYLFPYVLILGGLMGYYAAAPFIFISTLHISPQHYGFIQIAPVITYIFGINACRFITRWLGADKTIVLGIFISLMSALLLIIFYIFSSINVYTVLMPMIIFCLGGGLISPNANAGAMSALRHKAGSSGAVLSASIYAVSAFFSAIITNQNLNTLRPLSVYISVISLLALIGFSSLILFALRTENRTFTKSKS